MSGMACSTQAEIGEMTRILLKLLTLVYGGRVTAPNREPLRMATKQSRNRPGNRPGARQIGARVGILVLP